jgi:hypothetical protein
MFNKLSAAFLLFLISFTCATTLPHHEVSSLKYEFKGDALNKMLAIHIGTNSDVFMGYKVPLFSDRQYLALQPKMETTIAHRNWLSFTFFFIRAKVTFEAQAAKLAPYFKIMLDQIRYKDMCIDIGYMMSALELNLYTQLDILDCSAGFLGLMN